MRPLNIHRVIPSSSSIHPCRERERERESLSIDVPWISRGNIATRTLFPSYESLIILLPDSSQFSNRRSTTRKFEKIEEEFFVAIKRRGRGRGKFLITLITGGGRGLDGYSLFKTLDWFFPPSIRAKSRAIGSGSITSISLDHSI